MSDVVAEASGRWKRLSAADRRVLRRLTHFAGALPIEALALLTRSLGKGGLERLLAAQALRVHGGGFAVAPLFAELARAMPITPRERQADLSAVGGWLLEHIASVERFATDTAAAFDRLEPFVDDVRRVVGEVADREPALAARLWCAIGDLLFYRRLLAFDCPEYAIAVRCADLTEDAALRVHARIVLGRATIEVKPPGQARSSFEEARDLATLHGLEDWQGDAVRGLGWVFLAEGDVAAAKESFSRAHVLHRASHHGRGIADSCMALGVLCVLASDRVEADQLFFRAEALLRSRRDTVRLAKLGALRHSLGLASDRLASVEVDLQSLLARGQYWRGALLLARSEEKDAKRHAEVLADLAGVSWKDLVATAHAPSSIPSDPTPTRSWELRCEGLRRVLAGPDGTVHDLTRRGPLGKLLEALARSDGALSAVSLFEAAWPGERVRHEAALLRVYTTVRRLRGLGVPIATSGDGYFCDQVRATP